METEKLNISTSSGPTPTPPMDTPSSPSCEQKSSSLEMLTLVIYLYSSSSSTTPGTTSSSSSRELIAQLTTLLTFHEQKLALTTLKLLVYETFRYFLENLPSQINLPPPPAANSRISQRLSYDISRNSLKSWQNLILQDPLLNENQSMMTILLSDIQQLQIYFQTVKNHENLMFVCGDDPQDLDIYSNWINDEDNPNRSLTDTLDSISRSNKLNSDDYDHTDVPLPLTASFILAHGYEMPAPNIRVLLQQTRTATDMYGKNYTVYNMVVIQGKLEWTIEHRYSGLLF